MTKEKPMTASLPGAAREVPLPQGTPASSRSTQAAGALRQ